MPVIVHRHVYFVSFRCRKRKDTRAVVRLDFFCSYIPLMIFDGNKAYYIHRTSFVVQHLKVALSNGTK
jgi:hypothetical protein